MGEQIRENHQLAPAKALGENGPAFRTARFHTGDSEVRMTEKGNGDVMAGPKRICCETRLTEVLQS
jgi:hypothetical protein